MFVIKQATTADIPLINKLAWNVFPETYKNILSHEQILYIVFHNTKGLLRLTYRSREAGSKP